MWDEDGRRYLDYVGSWGPMLLGHNHPAIWEAVCKAAEKGLSFGAATEAEVESRRDPMPPPPPTAGLSYYARARAEEAHELACEEALTRNLMREVKAAQKRKERVEKKVRSMRV